MAEQIPSIATKPQIASKINIVAVMGLALAALDWIVEQTTGAGVIPPKWIPVVLAVQSGAVYVLRTWFSGTPIAGVIRTPVADPPPP